MTMVLMAWLPRMGTAQLAVLAAGGDGDQGAGSVAFSLGQVAYMATVTPAGVVTPGVQQTYPDPHTGLEGADRTDDPILFPNPAGDAVLVRIPAGWTGDRSVHVYDVSGRRLSNTTMVGTSTTIDLRGITTGSLLVELRHAGRRTHMFHLLKQTP